MVLAVDVGNSNIVFGLYQEASLLFCARAKTDALKSEHEYAVLINELLILNNRSRKEITGAALSSVVPALTSVVVDAIRLLNDIPVLSVGPGIKTGLNIRIDDPSEAGADLVCTSVGAIEKYPLPAIILDLGTATKITAVDRSKSFIGAAFVPGVAVSLGALSRSTAQLPSIGLRSQIKAIGTNTVDSMLSGSILGTASMLDGMVARYRKILGEVPTVVACGGLVDAIIPHCMTEMIIDKNLLLDGLMAIYRKNIN